MDKYTDNSWHRFCDAMNATHRELDKLKRRITCCVQCKVRQARFNSLYCSDACKRRFHAELKEEN